VRVADRGSFNKAAGDLLMSQSGVSQHIRDLEASLGADLFVRSPQGVQKTNAGELLYTYALQILSLVSEVEHEIMQAGQLHNPRLSLGTTPGVSVYVLPQWLRAFQERYTNLQVSLDAVKTVDVVNGVLGTRYDLGFLEGDLNELDRPELGHVDVLTIHYHLMVGAEHPWAQRHSVSPDELSQQPFINRQPDSRTRQWLERTLTTDGIVLNTAAELDSPGTVKYALLNGMGVGILPDYAVVGEVQRGEIRVLQLDGITLHRQMKLAWNKREPISSIQRAFLATIEADTNTVLSIL
ncbi:MAG: LysR family transcriptional regulator, partial [Chloroflexota bacterium]